MPAVVSYEVAEVRGGSEERTSVEVLASLSPPGDCARAGVNRQSVARLSYERSVAARGGLRLWGVERSIEAIPRRLCIGEMDGPHDLGVLACQLLDDPS